MIKTLSAALLAVSMLAAPAFAGAARTDAAKTGVAPIAAPAKVNAKADLGVKPALTSNPLDAKAHMLRRHHRHVRHHHRFHKQVGTHRLHHAAKVSIKHIAPSARRG
jgi:hypothetical protein